MKLQLREWNKDDAPELACVANNKKIANNLRDSFPNPYTEKAAREFIGYCMHTDKKKALYRAITCDGHVIGGISVSCQEDVGCKSAELGYWLAEEYWNKGIMTWAVNDITKKAWETLDLTRIFAEPFADNEGSKRVLEKCGFVKEGCKRKSIYKKGTVHDSDLYAMVKEDA